MKQVFKCFGCDDISNHNAGETVMCFKCKTKLVELSFYDVLKELDIILKKANTQITDLKVLK